METIQNKNTLLKLQQLLFNEYFMIDMREEGNNYNIYAQKKGYCNFEYLFGIPKNSIDKNKLKNILSLKAKKKTIKYSLFINSYLKPQ